MAKSAERRGVVEGRGVLPAIVRLKSQVGEESLDSQAVESVISSLPNGSEVVYEGEASPADFQRYSPMLQRVVLHVLQEAAETDGIRVRFAGSKDRLDAFVAPADPVRPIASLSGGTVSAIEMLGGSVERDAEGVRFSIPVE